MEVIIIDIAWPCLSSLFPLPAFLCFLLIICLKHMEKHEEDKRIKTSKVKVRQAVGMINAAVMTSFDLSLYLFIAIVTTL